MMLTGTITAVASLSSSGPGGGPMGGVIMDLSGNIFGVGQTGGSLDVGSVFELASGSPSPMLLGSSRRRTAMGRRANCWRIREAICSALRMSVVTALTAQSLK